jgi:hypothetical protein
MAGPAGVCDRHLCGVGSRTRVRVSVYITTGSTETRYILLIIDAHPFQGNPKLISLQFLHVEYCINPIIASLLQGL